jgi:Hemingway/CFA97
MDLFESNCTGIHNRYKILESKYSQIEQENTRILGRLTSIMWKPVKPICSNNRAYAQSRINHMQNIRKNENKRIQTDNAALLKRLQRTKAAYLK